MNSNTHSLAILNGHGIGAFAVSECGTILERNASADTYLARLGISQETTRLPGSVFPVPPVVGSKIDLEAADQTRLCVLVQEGSGSGERIVSFSESHCSADVSGLISSLARLGSVGDLAASIAHQFNNTLTVVLGQADLLLARLGESDSSASALNSIRHQGSLASEMATKILRSRRPVGQEPPIRNLEAAIRLAVSISNPTVHVAAESTDLMVELSRGHLYMTIDALLTLMYSRYPGPCCITITERSAGQSCLPGVLLGVRNPWATLIIGTEVSASESELAELKPDKDALTGLLTSLKHAGVHVFDGGNHFEVYLPRFC